MGPRRTSRGRAWWASGGVPFPPLRGALFPGVEDGGGGVGGEGGPVAPAVELHVAPALRPQHRRELVGGVEPDPALADQLRGAFLRFRDRTLAPPPPRAPAARRGIERVLDAKRPAVHALALLGRQRAHQLVTVPSVEHEHAAWLERAPEAVDHQAILVVGEVTDRAEEVDREVELTRELHVPDVLADEPQGNAGLGGGLPRAVELGLAEVHARHLEATAGELHPVAAQPPRGGEDPPARLERRHPPRPPP